MLLIGLVSHVRNVRSSLHLLNEPHFGNMVGFETASVDVAYSLSTKLTYHWFENDIRYQALRLV